MIEIRNAKYINTDNTEVDLEINHPNYGWIPYTFITTEEDTSYDSEIREALKGVQVAPYSPPSKEEITKIEQEANIQKALDYLSKTDFYYIRELSRNIPVPQEVENNRETYIKYLESVGFSTRENLKDIDDIK